MSNPYEPPTSELLRVDEQQHRICLVLALIFVAAVPAVTWLYGFLVLRLPWKVFGVFDGGMIAVPALLAILATRFSWARTLMGFWALYLSYLFIDMGVQDFRGADRLVLSVAVTLGFAISAAVLLAPFVHPRFIVKAVKADGWRVWDRKKKQWYGNPSRQYPEKLLAELNGLRRPEKLMELSRTR